MFYNNVKISDTSIHECFYGCGPGGREGRGGDKCHKVD